jgi:hypothetical protein
MCPDLKNLFEVPLQFLNIISSITATRVFKQFIATGCLKETAFQATNLPTCLRSCKKGHENKTKIRIFCLRSRIPQTPQDGSVTG